jgi:hypothetical protein
MPEQPLRLDAGTANALEQQPRLPNTIQGFDPVLGQPGPKGIPKGVKLRRTGINRPKLQVEQEGLGSWHPFPTQRPADTVVGAPAVDSLQGVDHLLVADGVSLCHRGKPRLEGGERCLADEGDDDGVRLLTDELDVRGDVP